MLIELFGTYFHFLEIPLIIFLTFVVGIRMLTGCSTIKVSFGGIAAKIFLFIGLFLCSILLSAINAYNTSLVLKEFFKWTEMFFITTLVFLYVKTETNFRQIYWLLFCSTFMAIIIVFHSVFKGEISVFSYRVFPSYEATFAFALIIPFIEIRKNKIVLLLTLLSFFSLVFSLSRGAWLAAVGCIYYFFIRYSKSTKLIIIFLFLLFIGIILVTPSVRDLFVYRSLSMGTMNDASNEERVVLYRASVNAFKKKPLFGVGALNLPEYLIHENVLSYLNLKKENVVDPHNTFLKIAAELGITGLTFFVLLVIACWNLLNQARKATSVSMEYIYGITAFFWVMFVNFMLGYIASQFRFYLALMFGLVLSLSRLQKLDYE